MNKTLCKLTSKTFMTGLLGISVGILSSPQIASAASFTLDFSTAPDNTILDPYVLDGLGQLIGGTTFSTTNKNIGDIWTSIGITIEGNRDATEPLGLFNTNCDPAGGYNENNFTQLCEGENGGSNGDNDLATGVGFNPQGSTNFPTNPYPQECLDNADPNNLPLTQNYNYCSEPQGNALMFEENVGDGNPDDDTNNGIITFTFDRNIVDVVKLDRIATIDDINATLSITFLDTTTFTETLDVTRENEVVFFGSGSQFSDNPVPIPQKNIDFFTVQLAAQGGTSSGAISGVLFTEFGDDTPELPESSTLLGLGGLGLFVFGGKAIKYIKGRKSNEQK